MKMLPFCALLLTFRYLRSFALAFACFCVRPRLERPRLGTADSEKNLVLCGGPAIANNARARYVEPLMGLFLTGCFPGDFREEKRRITRG